MPESDSAQEFIADAMLGSLARKLRMLGLDTSYFGRGTDQQLLDIASNERRAILTADRVLFRTAIRKGLVAVLIDGSNDPQRLNCLIESASSLGLRIVGGEPLCSVCGGDLERADRRALAGTLPAGVLSRHRKFYRCCSCGKCYWRGSHWKKLRSFERRLRTKRV